MLTALSRGGAAATALRAILGRFAGGAGGAGLAFAAAPLTRDVPFGKVLLDTTDLCCGGMLGGGGGGAGDGALTTMGSR